MIEALPLIVIIYANSGYKGSPGIYSSSIDIGGFSWIWGRISDIGTKRPENA